MQVFGVLVIELEALKFIFHTPMTTYILGEALTTGLAGLER
jgi:hypothetical protein